MKRKLHILATCQYGYPEPYPSMYPMEEMVQRGHYVHAITGTPNYPMGDTYIGYEHNKIIEEKHNGVHYTHVSVIPRKHNPVMRLLNYHSYPITAKKKILQMPSDFDVVFANQSSPVMMVEPALAYAKNKNKKVVMYCMDLWPASLCAGGLKKSSLLYKFYFKKSKKVYQNVDLILVTSRMFKQYFIDEFNIPEKKIRYLPQYAVSELDFINTKIEKNTVDFVFAGNVGVAQNLYVILDAAKIIQAIKLTDNGKLIYFHIIGDGQELKYLKEYALENKIDNVIFHGRKKQSEMPKYYAYADAMIVSLTADPLISLTLPAKVQSYMAAGKPILASANGEIAKVIEESEAGYCAAAGNPKDFVENVKKFIRNKDIDFGKNSKIYYNNNFSKKIVIDQLEKILYDFAY